MNMRIKVYSWMLGAAVCAGYGVAAASAQTPQAQEHVVTSDELSKQTAQPAETREANENAIRHLLSSDEGQKALKSGNVDYQRVDKAIGQLSDDELAKLAERSRQAERDFAAGSISAKTLAYIILAVVVIVVIVVLVQKI
jgi:hypothetical protein